MLMACFNLTRKTDFVCGIHNPAHNYTYLRWKVFQVKYQCKMRISYMPDCNAVPKVKVDFGLYPGNIAIIFNHIISHRTVYWNIYCMAIPTFHFILMYDNPVLKIAKHGAHVRGTKESLGRPKSWWTKKFNSLDTKVPRARGPNKGGDRIIQ